MRLYINTNRDDAGSMFILALAMQGIHLVWQENETGEVNWNLDISPDHQSLLTMEIGADFQELASGQEPGNCIFLDIL